MYKCIANITILEMLLQLNKRQKLKYNVGHLNNVLLQIKVLTYKLEKKPFSPFVLYTVSNKCCDVIC